MKKTYVTTMPDHVGAFLKASSLFAELNINITRVSYNKAVDIHTLFIEADGNAEQLGLADTRLREIGYLQSDDTEQSIVLLEFCLPDVPGSVTRILALIERFKFNLSYLSSQENGSPFQLFKMGLFVEDRAAIDCFLALVREICEVHVIDYNRAEKNFDNSIFYRSYAASLAEYMNLGEAERNDLMIHVNLAMQVLDEQGLSPYRTFDSVSHFAELLSRCRGEAFSPRISHHRASEETEIILIEPPCGSNTAILKHGSETLFIDSGYACYQPEMFKLFRELLPDFDAMPKHALITHADVDHCGLIPLFDRVDMSRRSADCLALESEGRDGFREQNPLHRPYIRICKILTGYRTTDKTRIHVISEAAPMGDAALVPVGAYRFGDLDFEIYEGAGGHLQGEIVLIDYAHHLVFPGDIFVNIKGMTAEQRTYNQYAPILMTSVDTDPALCAREREALMQRLGVGDWQIFGAHGMKKDYAVHT